jgi:hypothetical protein
LPKWVSRLLNRFIASFALLKANLGHGFLKFQTNTGFIHEFSRIFANSKSIRGLISDFEKTLKFGYVSIPGLYPMGYHVEL